MPQWIRSIADFFQVDATALVRYGARILAIWALAWVAAQLVNLIARRIEAAVDDGNDLITTSKEKRGRTISQLLRGVGRIVAFSIAVLLTIDVFMDIGPILAGFGILGLAVSFSAQSLVKDIISGFFILLEDQFAVGDVISVAGTSGVVEKMTLRVVMLRDMKGTVHVVPNSEIKVVSNMTRGWSRAVIDVAVAYDTDLDRAIAVVRDEAAAFSDDPAWKPQLDEPLDVPGVESLGESGIVVRVLARTQPGLQWAVAREFRRRIKMRFDRESIEIPFPQRRVHVTVDGAADDETIRAAGAAGGA